MKNRFSKLLSVILSLAMLVSMCGVTTFADGTDSDPGVYYVSYGASGDGLTADTPAGDLGTVIDAINNAGYGAGDNVTVMVDNKGVVDTWALDTTVPYIAYNLAENGKNHAATVTYATYSSDGVTTANARLRFTGGFLSNNTVGNSVLIAGPTVMDGVDFICGRYPSSERVLAAGERDITFINSTLLGVTTGGDGLTVDRSGRHQFQMGGNHGVAGGTPANGPDFTVRIDNVDTFKPLDISLSGYTGSANTNIQVIEGSATLYLGEGTLKTLTLDGSNAATPITFNKNVNIILDGTTVSGYSTRTSPTTIKGAYTVIKNGGASIDTDNVAVTTDEVYILTATGGVTLDITDTVGTFSVDGASGLVYVQENDKIYYSTGTTITVPAGEYTVSTAADVDTIMETAVAPKKDGYVFDGWTDDGEGTLTASFKVKEAETATYYVQWNTAATRDGSVDAPFKGVVEAINYINANTTYGTGDTVTLKVLNDDTDVTTLSGYAAGGAFKDYFWAYDANGNYIQNTDPATFFGTGNGTVESRLATWNNGETKYAGGHKYLLVVEGTGTGKDDAYLAQHFAIGRNTQSILSGPTHFKNIKLVTNRNVDREWCLDQNQATFENVLFTDPGCQQYGGTFVGMSDVCERESLSAIIFNRECDIHAPLASAGNGGTYTFKNVNFGGSLSTKQYGVFLGKHGITFTQPTTIVFEDCGTAQFLWGANYKDTGVDETTYLQQGLMIVADNTTVSGANSYKKTGADLGDTVITGGLTLVSKNGGTAPDIVQDEVTADGIYKLSYNDDVKLSITGEKGKYSVEEGAVYVLTDGGKTMYYGTPDNNLVLPTVGTYEVYYAENRDALDDVEAPAAAAGTEFVGWIETEEGVLVANYGEKIASPIYVKFGGTGDGSTKATPVGSVAAAIDRVNALGYVAGDKVPVIILEDDTDLTTLPGYNAENADADKYWMYDADGNYIGTSSDAKTSRFTYWKKDGGAAAKHAATIVVQGETGKTPYLAQTDTIGYNTFLTLSGPAIFKNINFVVNRNCDREFAANGYEVVLENFSFNYLEHGGSLLSIKKGHAYFLFAKDPNNAFGEGDSFSATFSNVDFGSPNSEQGVLIGRQARAEGGLKVNYPVTANFVNSTATNVQWGSDPLYSWGGDYRGPTYLNKGITIIADNTQVTNQQRSETVTVTGGILLVAKNGGTINTVPTNVTYDKLYNYTLTTDNTIAMTDVAGKFMTDAQGKYYVAMDASYNIHVGEVADDGTVSLPSGEWTVTFGTTDYKANDFAAVRALISDAAMAEKLVWTESATAGYYTSDVPKNKQVVPASSLASYGLEYNAGVPAGVVYTKTPSSIYGFNTNVFERVGDADTSADPVYPVIGVYSSYRDENGNLVKAKTARYATYFYYYETDETNPPLVGKTPQFNVGNLNAGSTSSSWLGTGHPAALMADDTIVANKWAYVTVDLWSNAGYKSLAGDTANEWVHNQMRLPVLGTSSTLMAYGEKFHLGPIWFTDYDPAEEIAATPQILFVSENGDDTNDGLSEGTAVKTFDRVYEIVEDIEGKVNVSVIGNVAGGNSYEGDCKATIVVAGLTEGASISGTVLADMEIGANLALEAVTIDGGHNVTLNSLFEYAEDITVVDGVLTVRGGEVNNVFVGAEEGIGSASVVVEGGSVVAVSQTENPLNGGDLSLGWSAGELGTVDINGTVDNFQLLIDYSYDVPAGINNIEVIGEKIILKTPIMKSATGIPFSVTPTETFGVFKTYDGAAINYGYGKTKYICWGVNEAGNKAYYSNSSTDFTLTIPESGTYRLDIAAEKDYTAANNKKITGFSVDTHLVLPEGYIGWDNDGEGTFTAITAAGGASTVYVSNKYGDDDNNGLTKDTPVKTLQEAVLKIGTVADGTVIILDGDGEYSLFTRDTNHQDGYAYGGEQDVLLYKNVPAHSGTITYMGDAADSVLCYGSDAIELKGPSVFKNLTLIEGYNHYKSFSTNGYDVSFENVTYYNTKVFAEGSTEFYTPNAGIIKTPAAIREIITGAYTATTASKGGRIVISDFLTTARETDALTIGGYAGNVFEGDITVEFDGGKIGVLNLFNSMASVNDLNFVYNGTVIENGIVDKGSGTAVNAIQIVNNNGNTFPTLPTFSAAVVAKGTWIMNSGENAGGTLDVTETAGTFKVISDKYAKATNDGGAVIFSTNGLITVPAGTWTVTYVDEAPVDFDGKVLTVNVATEDVNLGAYDAVVPANKLFIGWSKDEAGTEYYETAVNDFAAGQKAYAQFCDFSTALRGDISILGVQVRVAEDEVKQGMRFVTQVNKSLLTNLGINTIGGNDVTYGTIVLPASFDGANNLTLETANIAIVPAKNTYKNEINTIQYTAVLTDIVTANYAVDYNARSYIKYTDRNGVEQVAYGEQYGTSLYDTAKYALRNDDTLTEAQTAALEKIKSDSVSYIDAPVSFYAGWGKFHQNIPQSYDAATEENFAKGEVYYRTASGTNVREVHITGGTNENAKTATIGALQDTHINLINEKDKYDPELQYTYQTRPGFRGESTLNAFKNAVEFAGMYDQMVIVGDIIDYLSYGALDFIKEFALDPYPNGLYVMGGHDITKQMETGFGDETPEPERFEMLYEYYGQPTDDNPHNIHFSTRLVNDNVVCVNLNNGTNFQYRWDVQMAEKLQAVVDDARENGYIVLIFEHEPITTANPDHATTKIRAYDEASGLGTDAYAGGWSYYFTNGRVHMSSNDTATSLAVFDVIQKNSDVIKGVFSGHMHRADYSEIWAKNADGSWKYEEDGETHVVIPQYGNRSNAYNGHYGEVTKIVVTPAE